MYVKFFTLASLMATFAAFAVGYLISPIEGNNRRNEYIEMINDRGRTNWQKSTEYVLRALVELAIQGYKRIIGGTLKARDFRKQKTEAQASVRASNKMTQRGMPISVKIA